MVIQKATAFGKFEKLSGRFFMISKFKQIVSEKLRASGIRGCMAAGAVTAGIAALAVIGGINSDDISTVSFETDVIPEETSASTEAKAEKSVKRTYSHDMEYLSEEDIEKIEAEVNKADETETAVDVEETAPVADEAAEVSEEAPEAVYESSEEDADAEAEISDEEVSDNEADAQEADDSDDAAPEAEEESTDSVAVRSSAADGDDDGNGLSSALDLEVNDEAADSEEAVAVMSAEEEAPIALMAAPDAMEASEASDEADEVESDIPEDITLDDEDTAPEEDAVSLLDVPEWLSFDENGVPTEYVNVLTGNACAYTADPDALMSTGKVVFQGYVAVDPDIIPYGSELYIVAEDGEVYGYAIAADTGYSVRKGHIIVDLFMNEYDDCIQWGNKPVNVYVLK